MYSYRQFTPGGRSSTARIIKYITEYNEINGAKNEPSKCFCVPNKYDKNTTGSDSTSSRVSYATRISQVINNKRGGKIQYGNFYLGEQINVNYLGRVQGMPSYPSNVNYLATMDGMRGGSGLPPKNIFN